MTHTHTISPFHFFPFKGSRSNKKWCYLSKKRKGPIKRPTVKPDNAEIVDNDDATVGNEGDQPRAPHARLHHLQSPEGERGLRDANPALHLDGRGAQRR